MYLTNCGFLGNVDDSEWPTVFTFHGNLEKEVLTRKEDATVLGTAVGTQDSSVNKESSRKLKRL